MMGLWKVDNVSSEEWHRMAMRRHHVKRILITLGEILLMVVTVGWIVFLVSRVGP